MSTDVAVVAIVVAAILIFVAICIAYYLPRDNAFYDEHLTEWEADLRDRAERRQRAEGRLGK